MSSEKKVAYSEPGCTADERVTLTTTARSPTPTMPKANSTRGAELEPVNGNVAADSTRASAVAGARAIRTTSAATEGVASTAEGVTAGAGPSGLTTRGEPGTTSGGAGVTTGGGLGVVARTMQCGLPTCSPFPHTGPVGPLAGQPPPFGLLELHPVGCGFWHADPVWPPFSQLATEFAPIPGVCAL